MGNNKLEIWDAPAGTRENKLYEVYVKKTDEEIFHRLFVYDVLVGHQENETLQTNLTGKRYDGPQHSSYVNFDFSGEADVKIVYGHRLINYELSPKRHAVDVKSAGDNAVVFRIKQDENMPLKLVFRPNDSWEGEILHLLTNTPEVRIPDKTAENVYVVKSGCPVPRILPSGKDTYYFEKGVHVLPRGLWVDYDFGEEKTLCSFGFLTGDKRPRFVPGGMNIELYVKSDSDNDFELLYASFGKEDNIDLKDIPLPPKKARYARLVILGNTNHERDAIRIPQYSYFNACYVGEFVLTDASGENVALNKAICGAQKGYANASDGNPDSFYYDIYGGESFFIPQSGYSYYLEKGAVVKGSFTAEYVENINVFGRGILSLEEVTHNPVTVYAEARVSAFMIEHSRNFSVEGITVVDPPCWMVVLNSSEHPGVRRVNLFGRSTNSDGVHFSASRNAVCDGCFIRTCDDIFVAYHYGDSENLTFQNCTVYCDGGRVLLLGLADRGDIRRVTVRNCDVIHTQNVWNVHMHGGVIQINPTGGHMISDVLVENLRVERVRFPELTTPFQIKTVHPSYGSGQAKNITLRSISYDNPIVEKSYIEGDSPEHGVQNVTLENIVIQGVRLIGENRSRLFDVIGSVTNVKVDE